MREILYFQRSGSRWYAWGPDLNYDGTWPVENDIDHPRVTIIAEVIANGGMPRNGYTVVPPDRHINEQGVPQ